MEDISREMREAEMTWGRWTQLHDVAAGTYWVCCEGWYRRPEDEGDPPTLDDRPRSNPAVAAQMLDGHAINCECLDCRRAASYNPFSSVVETIKRKS